MVVRFEGAPTEPVGFPVRPPGSVVVSSLVVWSHALVGTPLGVGMFAAAAARYPFRINDMVIGLVITVVSLGTIVPGVFLVRGREWARITVLGLAGIWLVVEVFLFATLAYATFTDIDFIPMAALVVLTPLLVLAVLDVVALVLLNLGSGRAYFAVKAAVAR